MRPRPASTLLTWRAAELASARERRLLARSLNGIVRELDANRLPGSSPLNRIALRPHADRIAAIADRLAQLERPVAVLGILLIHDLLSDGGSPLYDRRRVEEISGTLASILDALEVH